MFSIQGGNSMDFIRNVTNTLGVGGALPNFTNLDSRAWELTESMQKYANDDKYKTDNEIFTSKVDYNNKKYVIAKTADGIIIQPRADWKKKDLLGRRVMSGLMISRDNTFIMYNNTHNSKNKHNNEQIVANALMVGEAFLKTEKTKEVALPVITEANEAETDPARRQAKFFAQFPEEKKKEKEKRDQSDTLEVLRKITLGYEVPEGYESSRKITLKQPWEAVGLDGEFRCRFTVDAVTIDDAVKMVKESINNPSFSVAPARGHGIMNKPLKMVVDCVISRENAQAILAILNRSRQQD